MTMTLSSKLLLLGILTTILFYGGYRVHQAIWQSGYSTAQAEFKAANDAAVRENEQTAREEAREIPKVLADLEAQRKFYQHLLTKVPKSTVVIERDPVTNVEIHRVYGLSADGVRLFNDAVRGKERTPEVRQNPDNPLSR